MKDLNLAGKKYIPPKAINRQRSQPFRNQKILQRYEPNKRWNTKT